VQRNLYTGILIVLVPIAVVAFVRSFLLDTLDVLLHLRNGRASQPWEG
jgi:uncharacterized membrane protein